MSAALRVGDVVWEDTDIARLLTAPAEPGGPWGARYVPTDLGDDTAFESCFPGDFAEERARRGLIAAGEDAWCTWTSGDLEEATR